MTPPGAPVRFLPYCGLPCPPARLTFEGDRLAGVEGACTVCRTEAAAPRLARARIAGQDAPIEAAIDRAAGLLTRSRRPFVYGLAASPVGTARLAARLAARLDAAVDVEGAGLLEPELAAIAATGQVMATFGEMRAAADLVVLWRVDPRPTHPDFLPRAFASGERRFVVVPPLTGGESRSPAPRPDRDLAVPVPPGRDLEALRCLRGLLNGTLPADALADLRALPVRELLAAADAVRSARRAVILWDGAMAAGTPDGAAIAAGFALLTLDTRRARLAAKALGARGHVAGAMAGLLSATGFPNAVGFAAGRPRRDPDRFGATRQLRGGADLVLAVEPLGPSQRPACPVILVGSRLVEGWGEPEVLLPIHPPALRGGGLWLRSDGVPIVFGGADAAAPPSADTVPGSPATPPSEAMVLGALLERLQAAA